MEKGKPKREDQDYERHGKCALFLAVEPLAGFCQVWVRSQRTMLDFAVILKELVAEIYSDAHQIGLGSDNLNSQHTACLYQRYSPVEARRIAEKLALIGALLLKVPVSNSNYFIQLLTFKNHLNRALGPW